MRYLLFGNISLMKTLWKWKKLDREGDAPFLVPHSMIGSLPEHIFFHCSFCYFEFFESKLYDKFEVNRVNEIKKSTFATIMASESLWTHADSTTPCHVVTGSVVLTGLFPAVVYFRFLCWTHFRRNCRDFWKCKIGICLNFCLFSWKWTGLMK